MSEIKNKINYVVDSSYLPNMIREYDIAKANINILLSKGCISQELYTKLYNSERDVRQITIGKMLREDKGLVTALKEGLIEYKNLFYDANNIQDENIVSIHNDAIFISGIIPKVTKFGNVEFMYKNTFTSFYKICGLEFYYFLDVFTDNECIEVKGITDDKLRFHKDYFLEFLMTIFATMQTEPIEESVFMIKKFTEKYLRRELNIEYYREFNSNSKFKFGEQWLSDGADQKYVSEVNIVTNLQLLRELNRIVSEIYFSKF